MYFYLLELKCVHHMWCLWEIFFDYGYCYYVSLRSQSRQEDEREMKFNFTVRWAAVGPRPPTCCMSVCVGFTEVMFLAAMMLYAVYRDKNTFLFCLLNAKYRYIQESSIKGIKYFDRNACTVQWSFFHVRPL